MINDSPRTRRPARARVVSVHPRLVHQRVPFYVRQVHIAHCVQCDDIFVLDARIHLALHPKDAENCARVQKRLFRAVQLGRKGVKAGANGR